MLDGDVVFAHGQFDVGGGHVVLEIHPLAAGWHRRDRAGTDNGAVFPVKPAACGADNIQIRGVLVRHEAVAPFVVAELAACLRVELRGRVQSPRHGDEVAVHLPGRSVRGDEAETPYAGRSPGGQRRGARMHGNTAFLGGVQQLSFDIATRIDDGAHRRSGIMHGKQRMPPEIVVDHPGNPLSAIHRVPPGIRMDGTGQHDSGQVVVAEQHGLLGRAGGQHDASRPHLMEGLHRAVASVGGAPIMDRHQVVVIAAGGRGIGHEPDVVHAIQLSKGRFQPIVGSSAIDRHRIVQYGTTERHILFGNQNILAAAAGFQCGR